jgi:predicted ABC-type ATPase
VRSGFASSSDNADFLTLPSINAEEENSLAIMFRRARRQIGVTDSIVPSGSTRIGLITTDGSQVADFAFETTLSTRSYVNTVKQAKVIGYEVTLLYFWLNSKELAIERVKERVKEGGHNIPEQVIRRRYKKGIKNLISLFIPIVDNWMIVDNSGNPFKTVAEGSEGERSIIHDKNIWDRKN